MSRDMNILPPPVVSQLSEAKAQPVASGAPLSNSGTADHAAQSSFPGALAQANQQGGPPKAVSGGKDPSGGATSSSGSQGEVEGNGIIGSESTDGGQLPVTPLTLQQLGAAAGQKSVENPLMLSSATKALGEYRTGDPSQIVVAPKTSLGVADEPGNVKTPSGASLFPLAGKTNAPLEGVVGSAVSQISTHAGKSIKSQSLQLAPQSNTNDQPVVLPLTREAPVSLQSGLRFSASSVPSSFGNSVLSQGKPFVDPGQALNLSQAISQNIQGTLPGTSGVTVIDSTGNFPHAVVGEGHTETGGSSLGSDQRSGQENGSVFANKQQASGQGLGGFSFHSESVNEFRGSDTLSAARTDMLADRTRTMNMLSSQRMQLEVMLSDESKVQVEVSVKQQLVSAHLLTDQMMLRNLAIQQEPQLTTQLSSVGLELKQFGAEVGEQGLFGQHLSDSSSRNSLGGGGHEASESQGPEVLLSAGVEADGRLHYVA